MTVGMTALSVVQLERRCAYTQAGLFLKAPMKVGNMVAAADMVGVELRGRDKWKVGGNS